MAYTDHFFMDKPSKELRDMLNELVKDPRSVDPEEAGPRGSSLEGGTLPRSVGGRPRTGSKKRAHNRKRVYGPEPEFDSLYKA